jgi:hypothetical protein
MAKTNTTTTITITVTAEALMAIVTGKYKGITLAGQVAASPAADQPIAKKVYDESTCASIPVGNLSTTLDALRGSGMIKRVSDQFGIDYSMASTLVSAESAAKKAKRDTLFIVPTKAEAIKAIIAKL